MNKRRIDWNHVEWFLAQIVFCVFCVPTAVENLRNVMASEDAIYESNPVKWIAFCVTIVWWMLVTPCGPIEYIRSWQESR